MCNRNVNGFMKFFSYEMYEKKNYVKNHKTIFYIL